MVSNQERAIITNAFALSMLNNPRRAVVEFQRITIEEVRQILSSSNVIHFVRHPATLQLIEQLAGRSLPSGGNTYLYQRGDVVVMAVLSVPQRGQEVAAVRPEDIVFYRITVHEIE